MKGIKDIKDLLAALEAAEKKSNEIDEAWEKDPNNQALEAAWIVAYKAETKANAELVASIIRVTNGIINEKEARAIVLGKREALKELLSRV